MTFIRTAVVILFVTALTFTACKQQTSAPACEGGVDATVVDLEGLDGCKYVFELSDGARLLPQIPAEGTTGDPLSNFIFGAGKKVTITYEAVDGMTTCMAGKLVKINCLVEHP
ncbi:hypothetical protein [Parachryseolinea silvisoli]|jgi:hypothetical protein|uniref:hypothetical protein n=1 Tax=Parachryseolinea silvisoli TaxID=2873601 RepID=UPI002265DF98|nr:hypothetical protein [Parachryseolinea silvisoli]MCD9015033.1 hypothetical protein [Parachryseolinea silvisoli]